MTMRERKDVDSRVSKIWKICGSCGNHFPSFGDEEPCDNCGYDEFAEYRNPFGFGKTKQPN